MQEFFILCALMCKLNMLLFLPQVILLSECYVEILNTVIFCSFVICFRVMYPPKKRHAGSHFSLQTVGSMKYVCLRDQQGIDQCFPVDDMQYQRVFNIVSGQDPAQMRATGDPTQQMVPQGSFSSLPSATSFQSGISSHSSVASSLNVAAQR